MEIWVGTPLVDRSTYPTKLTPAGVVFREAAEETLHALFQVRDELRSRRQLDRDTISFSAQHTISLWFFPKWLNEIKPALEPITTRLVADNMHNCVRSLTEGDCDFLICYHHPSIPLLLDSARYPHRVLGSDRLIPASAADGRSTPRYALPGTKRAPLPYLAYSADVFLGGAVELNRKQRDQSCHLRRVYENAMAESLKVMAIEGHGLAWLPYSSIKRDLRNRRLLRAGGKVWDIPLEIRIYRSIENPRPKVDALWSRLPDATSGRAGRTPR